MSKNKPEFTPGPWHRMFMTHILAEGNGYVATAHDSPLGPKANRANAALIAQSPSLYVDERGNVKFLGGLRDFFTSIVEDTVPPQKDDLDTAAKIWIDSINRRMSEITELLAKARGEDAE